MEKTLFEKIRDGDLPSYRVYDDDIVFAILDIHPVTPGHTLVITKEAYTDTAHTPDAVVAHLAMVTKKIATVLMTELGYTGYNIEVNTGADAGQIIMHTHWHIIPRKAGDGLVHWKGMEYKDTEAQILAQRLHQAVAQL